MLFRSVVGGPALTELFRASHGELKLRDIVLQAEAGDASCQRVIADAGRHIGIAAASLCNLIDPDRIVIGGELAEAGEILLAPLRHALERSTLSTRGSVPDVVQSELGDKAEVMGAVLAAIDTVRIASSIS